jgi:hypothetical protein
MDSGPPRIPLDGLSEDVDRGGLDVVAGIDSVRFDIEFGLASGDDDGGDRLQVDGEADCLHSKFLEALV